MLRRVGKACSFNLILSIRSSSKSHVSVNGCSSEELKLTHGVPQGLVLGPLLFLVFINDLLNVSKHLSFYLFADDTNVYLNHLTYFRYKKLLTENSEKFENGLKQIGWR